MAMSLGVQMMLKGLGVDMAEIEKFGSQAGQIVAGFNSRLEKIESDLSHIIEVLENNHGERNDEYINGASSEETRQDEPQTERRHIAEINAGKS